MKSIVRENLKYWIFSFLSLVVISFYDSASFAGKTKDTQTQREHDERSGSTRRQDMKSKSSHRHSQHLKDIRAKDVAELLKLAKESGDQSVRLIALNNWADALEEKVKIASSNPENRSKKEVANFRTRAAVQLCKLAKSLHKHGFPEAASLRASNAMSFTSSADALDSYRWLILK